MLQECKTTEITHIGEKKGVEQSNWKNMNAWWMYGTAMGVKLERSYEKG